MLSVASVAVSLGLRLINEEMTLVTGLTILILAPEYFLPVRLVGADFHATLDGKEAGEAMKDIIDRDTVKAEPLSVDGLTSAQPLQAGAFGWKSDSTLTLEGIGVQYEADGISSLTDVNLAFTGAAKIGIIGESGAGKSTLVDILGGFLHPTSGSLSINGNRVSALTDEEWRRQTAYIPQRPYIFSGTLADNVRFYYPEATLAEVEAVMKAAGLSQLVSSFPDGLNEMIGGGGRVVSGGQEQRIALARALLSSRPVMLLDEPTAHLDIETEYELKETMLPLFEGKLVFLATHRLHWMMDMDLIVVMQQGRVAEAGTHRELIRRRGAYYGLIQSQLEGIH